MRFENATPFPGFLFRTSIDDHRIAAAAIVRATFLIDPAKRTVEPSTDQPWKVSPNPWKGPRGPMEHDAQFDRDGCDIVLFGSARSASGEPIASVDVGVRVGDFAHAVRVFGDRTWVRDASGKLAPSPPTPFTEMPLDLEHAFGGTSDFDELDVPFPDNPRGKGFVWEEAQAEGTALPNIEHPAKLVQSWDDRPEPVGVGLTRKNFGPRLRRAAIVNEKGQLLEVRDSIHNVAFPDMVAPTVAPGAPVRVVGMSAAPLEFALPVAPLSATTRVGAVEYEDPMRIDQVGVEVDDLRLFVTYRYTFTYVVRKGDERRCTVRWNN